LKNHVLGSISLEMSAPIKSFGEDAESQLVQRAQCIFSHVHANRIKLKARNQRGPRSVATAEAAAATTARSYGAAAAAALDSAARCSRSEHGHLAADIGASTGWTQRFVVMSGPDERLERIIAVATMIFVDWHERISLLY
jgi:hypothetical protein